jgi:Co/Zn/Cd efflux system component
LIRSSGSTLLDMVPDPTLSTRVSERLEVNGDRVSDLHLWRVGPGHAALVASIVTDKPHDPAICKERLKGIEVLSHVTVEVHTCREHRSLD